jgi:hypothetical protein
LCSVLLATVIARRRRDIHIGEVSLEITKRSNSQLHLQERRRRMYSSYLLHEVRVPIVRRWSVLMCACTLVYFIVFTHWPSHPTE